jgi:hypothetical protein
MAESRVAFALSAGFSESGMLKGLHRHSLCPVRTLRSRPLIRTVACLPSGGEQVKRDKPEGGSPGTAAGHAKRDVRTRGPAALLRYRAFKLRRQFRDARTIYDDAAATARALKSEPGDILGADLNATSLGLRSTVQDLLVPACPKFVPMTSTSVASALRSYMRAVAEAGAKPYLLNELDEALPRILARVRADMSKLADDASTIFDSSGEEAETSSGVRSLLTLLQCARFHCNSPPPLSPPSMTALPVQLSKLDCLDPGLVGTSELSQHPLLKSQREGSALVPYAVISTRGTGVVRESGAQFGAKIRSIEQLYLGWVDAPVRLIQKFFWYRKDANTSENLGKTAQNSAKVRRVYPTPTIQLRRGLTALVELTLPIFTQEPTHEQWVLLYRDFEPDRTLQRFAWGQRMLDRAKAAVFEAIRPHHIRTSTDDMAEWFASPLGSSKSFHLEMYRDVPWGNVSHFYPSCAVSIVPKTRDLLRVDLLTLAGLLSLGVTFIRDVDHVLVTASALGTAVVYAARVVFAIRQALTVTRQRVAEERLSQMIGMDEAAVARLATLAAEQEFAVAASVYIASVVNDPRVTGDYVAKKAFEVDLDINSDFWRGQLFEWGILEAGRVLRDDATTKGSN